MFEQVKKLLSIPPTKRYRLPRAIYDEFKDGLIRENFISQQLAKKGFDLDKKIYIYKGVNTEVYLYEQDSIS